MRPRPRSASACTTIASSSRPFVSSARAGTALYNLSLRHGRKSPPWKRMAIARALARHNREEMPSPTRVLGCDRSGLYLLFCGRV